MSALLYLGLLGVARIAVERRISVEEEKSSKTTNN